MSPGSARKIVQEDRKFISSRENAERNSCRELWTQIITVVLEHYDQNS